MNALEVVGIVANIVYGIFTIAEISDKRTERLTIFSHPLSKSVLQVIFAVFASFAVLMNQEGRTLLSDLTKLVLASFRE